MAAAGGDVHDGHGEVKSADATDISSQSLLIHDTSADINDVITAVQHVAQLCAQDALVRTTAASSSPPLLAAIIQRLSLTDRDQSVLLERACLKLIGNAAIDCHATRQFIYDNNALTSITTRISSKDSETAKFAAGALVNVTCQHDSLQQAVMDERHNIISVMQLLTLNADLLTMDDADHSDSAVSRVDVITVKCLLRFLTNLFSSQTHAARAQSIFVTSDLLTTVVDMSRHFVQPQSDHDDRPHHGVLEFVVDMFGSIFMPQYLHSLVKYKCIALVIDITKLSSSSGDNAHNQRLIQSAMHLLTSWASHYPSVILPFLVTRLHSSKPQTQSLILDCWMTLIVESFAVDTAYDQLALFIRHLTSNITEISRKALLIVGELSTHKETHHALIQNTELLQALIQHMTGDIPILCAHACTLLANVSVSASTHEYIVADRILVLAIFHVLSMTPTHVPTSLMPSPALPFNEKTDDDQHQTSTMFIQLLTVSQLDCIRICQNILSPDDIISYRFARMLIQSNVVSSLMSPLQHCRLDSARLLSLMITRIDGRQRYNLSAAEPATAALRSRLLAVAQQDDIMFRLFLDVIQSATDESILHDLTTAICALLETNRDECDINNSGTNGLIDHVESKSAAMTETIVSDIGKIFHQCIGVLSSHNYISAQDRIMLQQILLSPLQQETKLS